MEACMHRELRHMLSHAINYAWKDDMGIYENSIDQRECCAARESSPAAMETVVGNHGCSAEPRLTVSAVVFCLPFPCLLSALCARHPRSIPPPLPLPCEFHPASSTARLE